MRYLILAILVTGWLSAAVPISNLPKETSWVLHLDVERLRAGCFTELARKIVTQHEGSSVRWLWNHDPLLEWDAVTLVGLGNTREDVAVLIKGKHDQQRLISVAKLAKEYQLLEESGVTIHSWIETQGDRVNKRTFGCLLTNDLLVLTSGDHIRTMVQVAKGKHASLDGKNGLGHFLQGEALLVGAGCEALVQKLPQYPGMQSVQKMKVVLDETQRLLTLRLAVSTQSAETAKQMKQMGETLVAMALLNRDFSPVLLEALKTIRFSLLNTNEVHAVAQLTSTQFMTLFDSLATLSRQSGKMNDDKKQDHGDSPKPTPRVRDEAQEPEKAGKGPGSGKIPPG